MSPDDPRHGSTAGYSEHMRSDRKPCQPCRRANNVRPSKGTNFINGGYDPKDELTGGRWMWDDRRAIRVWVVVEPPKRNVGHRFEQVYPDPPKPPTRICGCGEPTLHSNSPYCPPCSDLAKRRNWRESKRRAYRAARMAREDNVA